MDQNLPLSHSPGSDGSGPILELTRMAAGDIVPAGQQLRQRRAARPLNSSKEEDVAKEVFCTFGIDVDAVAGWLGSYGGEDSPCDITRGLFAGEIGSPSLLKMFDKYGLRTTWFIPGHSIETFPRQMQMVADAGHEIGLHGYSHENPVAMTPEQEETVLNKCIDL